MVRHRWWIVPFAAFTSLLVLAAGGQALTPDAGAAVPPSADAAEPKDQTAGCGQAPTLEDGTHTIQSGGQDRTFILDVPDNYDNSTPYRLVFGLHWWGGTAENVASAGYYGLQPLANNSTIFVSPQGFDNAWPNTGGQDVAFIDDILAMIEADLCVDTSLRFSQGFSYGGAMSIALACARPDVFRAIVSQSSPGPVSGCDGGTEPVAFMGIHGISDQFGNTHEQQRDMFVTNNGCTPQTPPTAAPGSLTHITTTYEGCMEGYPVVWASFDGGHIASPQDGVSGDGPDSWAPDESWDFITQFESTTQ
jgi:poly(3-hydroxybutyrate) depolymerase